MAASRTRKTRSRGGVRGTATFLVSYTVTKLVEVSGESYHSTPGQDLFNDASIPGNVDAVHSRALVGWVPAAPAKRKKHP